MDEAWRVGFTVRGMWAVVAAVGGVFLAAAGSYALLFPGPPGGVAWATAVGAATVGAPAVLAGLSEVWACRGRPLFTGAGPFATDR